MKSYPSNISFKFPWRKYQKKVLNELDVHLDDNHLHIIAPPGSGKTVLGLEVAKRLNKPTLVFAPTLAIRNQWIQRFIDLFLPENDNTDWISNNLHSPKFLTVSTYQSLHALMSGKEIKSNPKDYELETTKDTNKQKSFLVEFNKIGFKTIVVDEAHHLKNEWWTSLNKLKKILNPTIVGLTATPPYDVSLSEWERYMNLCGPVDAEIFVPDLVVEGDLCPHQDFIHFTTPTQKETDYLNQFRVKVATLLREIVSDGELLELLQQHPFYLEPQKHLELIYDNLEYFSSILIFMNESQIKIPKTHFLVLGADQLKIPKLTIEWYEILLTNLIFKDHLFKQKYEIELTRLEKKLRRLGVIERRQIKLTSNQKIEQSLGSSLSKLKSIKEIIQHEYSTLGNDLRLVVLTDYIRKEYFGDIGNIDIEFSKLGVIPIFETIRRNQKKIRVAILTGSLVIVPIEILTLFQEISKKYGIQEISYRACANDNSYVEINVIPKLKKEIVLIVTKLFENGAFQVLIGTKALLGEGWDAPSINSLVLASYVGSFVSSNQMRGRAIRSVHGNGNKTGNIWHLICLDEKDVNNGHDFEIMTRRFKAFVGLSFDEKATIQNGISRLNLPKDKIVEQIATINKTMFEKASQRENLKLKWDVALQEGTIINEEIKIPYKDSSDKTYKQKQRLYFKNTIKNISGEIASSAFVFMDVVFNGAEYFQTIENLLMYAKIVGLAGVCYFTPKLYKVGKLYLKHGSIGNEIYKIAQAIVQSLITLGHIETSPSAFYINSKMDEDGSVFCSLHGASVYEKSIFIKAMEEVLNPIKNPRYVIFRENRFIGLFSQVDYHSVPEIFSAKKKFVLIFQKQWEANVGKCKVLFTRNLDGRKFLINARLNALSSHFRPKTETISIWK